MSMSVHIIGYRPPDEEWDRKKAAFDACRKAGVEPPSDLWEFFGHEDPGDRPGAEISISGAVVEWQGLDASGYELDVEKLPEGLRIIRFYNAW